MNFQNCICWWILISFKLCHWKKKPFNRIKVHFHGLRRRNSSRIDYAVSRIVWASSDHFHPPESGSEFRDRVRVPLSICQPFFMRVLAKEKEKKNASQRATHAICSSGAKGLLCSVPMSWQSPDSCLAVVVVEKKKPT